MLVRASLCAQDVDDVSVAESPDVEDDAQFVCVGRVERSQRRMSERPVAFD